MVEMTDQNDWLTMRIALTCSNSIGQILLQVTSGQLDRCPGRAKTWALLSSRLRSGFFRKLRMPSGPP